MINRLDLLNQFKEWNEFEIIDLDWKTPIDEGKWTPLSHI
jgi:hypothetical protein